MFTVSFSFLQLISQCLTSADVFLGDDENSRRVSTYWESEEIRNVVTRNSCIALKLVAGSEPAKQFGQICKCMLFATVD